VTPEAVSSDLSRTAATVQAIRRLAPRHVDRNVLGELIGEVVVENARELGVVFGLSHNTIRQSWRPAGLPGAVGEFNVVDVLCWRLEYEEKLRKGSDADEPLDVTTVEQRLDAAIERRLGRFERGLRKAVAK
jgi:hypothetical protein